MLNNSGDSGTLSYPRITEKWRFQHFTIPCVCSQVLHIHSVYFWLSWRRVFMKNIFQILAHASFESIDSIIQVSSFHWIKNYVSRFPDGEPFFQFLTQLGYSVIVTLLVHCWILFANFLCKICHFIHAYYIIVALVIIVKFWYED